MVIVGNEKHSFDIFCWPNSVLQSWTCWSSSLNALYTSKLPAYKPRDPLIPSSMPEWILSFLCSSDPRKITNRAIASGPSIYNCFFKGSVSRVALTSSRKKEGWIDTRYIIIQTLLPVGFHRSLSPPFAYCIGAVTSLTPVDLRKNSNSCLYSSIKVSLSKISVPVIIISILSVKKHKRPSVISCNEGRAFLFALISRAHIFPNLPLSWDSSCSSEH